MKILHCLDSLSPEAGGPARSVPQLAMAQALSGHEVGIWSADEVSPVVNGGDSLLFADLGKEGEDLLTVFFGSFSDALDLFTDVDVVHDHGIWRPNHREVTTECLRRQIPFVVSPRGMLEPWALNHKKWKKRLAWWLYQKKNLQSASGLHATADAEADQLKQLGLRSPIVIAANGVTVPDTESITTAPKSGKKTALFLSRVHPKKGLPLLVDAWAKIRPVDWEMRVVGPDEGGHRKELEDKVAAAGLSDCWSFEDSLEGENKFRAMMEADLFVLPSYSENFGIVVAEALACETPVISTKGTPWAGLEENRCGWWVAPDVNSLVEVLNVAMELSPEDRSEMGARGRVWMSRDFTWSAIAGTVVNFYRQILEEE